MTNYTIYAADNSTYTSTATATSLKAAQNIARSCRMDSVSGGGKVQIEAGNRVIASWSEQSGKWIKADVQFSEPWNA